MYNWLVKIITSLGVFNHLVVSLILMIPIYFIFKISGYQAPQFIGAFATSLAYYFREVTQAQWSHVKGINAYNPMKWRVKDRQQTLIVLIGTFSCAILLLFI